MSSPPRRLDSVCVFCGSSGGAEPAFIAAAARLGNILAGENLRLVYGGGGVGLMGACARAAHLAGGRVLGVIPAFLAPVESPPPMVETRIVASMHERKTAMFEAADAFVVLPGAIGTLEEAIEMLSWRRLGLHAKPIVFYNPEGFWDPLFALFAQFTDAGLLPAEFAGCWRAVSQVAEIVPALRAMPATFMAAPGVTALT